MTPDELYRRERRKRIVLFATTVIALTVALSWLMLEAPLDELFCDIDRSPTACVMEPEP